MIIALTILNILIIAWCWTLTVYYVKALRKAKVNRDLIGCLYGVLIGKKFLKEEEYKAIQDTLDHEDF